MNIEEKEELWRFASVLPFSFLLRTFREHFAYILRTSQVLGAWYY
ncbi:hypothetical protein JOC94_003050 [Bacillus thermophilus]|uniref:Uncharacterized protein n=1 Tax=Siminovitchia thermophila TaxID=1245522 RepID=A0ABS2R8U7_9BACI|nr:hypothetical protein [Siminovitchia thermophila]